MTKVAILAVPDAADEFAFRAVAGERQSVGRTAGEALGALAAQLPEYKAATLLVVRPFRPDAHFRAA